MLYVVRKAEVRVRAHPAVVEGKYRWIHDYYRNRRNENFAEGETPIVALYPVEKHKKDIEDYIDFVTERWGYKYKVVVTKAFELIEGTDQMEVAFSLYDKPGEGDDPESMFYAGERAEVKVTYSFDNQVLHIDSAFLSSTVQGQGMGTDIVHHAIEYGLEKGIKEINLVADGTTGVYAWARMGFDFSSEGVPGQLNQKITKKLKDEFRHYIFQNYKKVVQPNEIEHSWQIANYVIDGEKVGKDWMLGPGEKFSYYATMDLEAYRNWKKEKGLEKSRTKGAKDRIPRKHRAGYDYDFTTGEGQKRMMYENRPHQASGVSYDPSWDKPIDVHAPGDYGSDPLGEGKFRMVPSGDIVDFEERNKRLKKSSGDYECPYDGLPGVQLRRFKQGAFWVREFRCSRGHVWQRVQ
jgi:GNAT superfamily N-acetyltransferase